MTERAPRAVVWTRFGRAPAWVVATTCALASCASAPEADDPATEVAAEVPATPPDPVDDEARAACAAWLERWLDDPGGIDLADDAHVAVLAMDDLERNVGFHVASDGYGLGLHEARAHDDGVHCRASVQAEWADDTVMNQWSGEVVVDVDGGLATHLSVVVLDASWPHDGESVQRSPGLCAKGSFGLDDAGLARDAWGAPEELRDDGADVVDADASVYTACVFTAETRDAYDTDRLAQLVVTDESGHIVDFVEVFRDGYRYGGGGTAAVRSLRSLDVGIGRAVLSAEIAHEYTFEDYGCVESERLTRTVLVAVPDGGDGLVKVLDEETANEFHYVGKNPSGRVCNEHEVFLRRLSFVEDTDDPSAPMRVESTIVQENPPGIGGPSRTYEWDGWSYR